MIQDKPSPRSRRLSARGDTRQALIDSALKMLDGGKSFDSLSLRELTRSIGVVPTAFYRHFNDMPELGQAMVEEAFSSLRQILAEVRSESSPDSLSISRVLKLLLKHVKRRRQHFRFIAAERYSGDAAVKQAVRRELRLIQGELAADLSRLDAFASWGPEEMQMVAGVVLNNLIAVIDEILEDTSRGGRPRERMIKQAEEQLRLIFLGVSQWRAD